MLGFLAGEPSKQAKSFDSRIKAYLKSNWCQAQCSGTTRDLLHKQVHTLSLQLESGPLWLDRI